MESYLIGAIIFCSLALICTTINLYYTLKESKEQASYINFLIASKNYFEKQAEDFKESRWNHNKSTANRIVAQFNYGFCHNNDYFEVLYRNSNNDEYHDVSGDTIPLSAIEKWIEL